MKHALAAACKRAMRGCACARICAARQPGSISSCIAPVRPVGDMVWVRQCPAAYSRSDVLPGASPLRAELSSTCLGGGGCAIGAAASCIATIIPTTAREPFRDHARRRWPVAIGGTGGRCRAVRVWERATGLPDSRKPQSGLAPMGTARPAHLRPHRGSARGTRPRRPGRETACGLRCIRYR